MEAGDLKDKHITHEPQRSKTKVLVIKTERHHTLEA